MSFITFLSSLKTSGAIAPVSSSSIHAMLHDLDRKNIHTIVEYGPGLGGFTREILQYAHADARVICFEINHKDFHPHLDKIVDHRLQIHYTSCEYIQQYVDAESVDLIISTIPFTLIGKDIGLGIMQASAAVLKPGGIFLTGQYRSFVKRMMHQVFDHVQHRRHRHNFPPLQIMKSIK